MKEDSPSYSKGKPGGKEREVVRGGINRKEKEHHGRGGGPRKEKVLP